MTVDKTEKKTIIAVFVIIINKTRQNQDKTSSFLFPSSSGHTYRPSFCKAT